MPGGRLTDEDRRQIAAGLAEGLGYAAIGRRLGRPASTIMREVTRNGGPGGYQADRARQATRRRAHRQKRAPERAPAPEQSHDRDPRQVGALSESLTALFERQGLPPMAARVLACLYLTDSGALTVADLVRQLRVSPASISHAVGFLEQQGLLGRQRIAGARRERYVVDDEIWVRSTLAAARMNDELVTAWQHGADVLGSETPAGARFAASAEFLSLVSDALRRSIEQWQEHRDDRTDRP
ncbi:MarR family transcriptional regulator [Actinocatenispora thailandica]|uniref:MarR family transcriptional regulator n=1 Tax=Actinocatenispora thailandica TaxID=227318 RepID=A0A7R7DT51_9ACTN|nr:helix-turn-helix domain-containing protein [Actinocatenispora thailandica]BCJ37365.1 MarR family transcriptional regulator [Actinocatenispora thailandica]